MNKLALFLITLILLLGGITYVTWTTAEKALNEKTMLAGENLLQQNKIDRLEDSLLELNTSIGVYLSLKDAGFQAGSIEEINKLLALSKKSPFGSPFRDGYRMTSPWGPRLSPITGQPSRHYGVDIVSLGSWVVVATADGEIIDFGESEVYGKYVLFETAGGYRIKYAHLSKIYYQDLDKKLVKGVRLTRGQRIGVMGDTGQATGAHLHYEVMVFNPESDSYVHLAPEEILRYIGE